MIDATLIEDLVRAGVAPDLVGRVAHMMVEAEKLAESRDALEKRRVADRDRQQKRRDKVRETGTGEKPKRANSHVSSRDSHVTQAGFDHFWSFYPSRGGASNPKKPAREIFEREVRNGADPAAIALAAMRYRDIERNAGRDRTGLIAQAKTWLGQQRWNDYPPPVADVPVVLTHGAKLQDGVYVMADTPEWEAWCRYLRQQGKTTPPIAKSGGWRFETLWPPAVAMAPAF
jgi:hypothetical protein